MSASADLIENLITAHKNDYEAYSRYERDIILLRYRGALNNLGGIRKYGPPRDSAGFDYTASFNLTHCVVDTALAGLVPPNPRVCVNGKVDKVKRYKAALDEMLGLIFDSQDMHQHVRATVFDNLTAKRGIFKVEVDCDRQLAISTIEPSRFWYDRTARDHQSCRYHMEYATIPLSQFRLIAQMPEYGFDEKACENINGTSFPDWLLDEDRAMRDRQILDAERWVNLVYYVDCSRNEMTVFSPDTNCILACYKLEYGSPYIHFDMVYDGYSTGGIAEAGLIQKTQHQMDSLLTLVLTIVSKMVPGMFYDKGQIEPSSIAAAEGEKGRNNVFSYVPLERTGSGDSQRPLDEVLMPTPMPMLPPEIATLLDRLIGYAASESAFVEASRGRQMNVRTAKELQMMEAQLDSRLATRVTRLNRALEAVARRVIRIMQDLLPAEGVQYLDGKYGKLTAKILAKMSLQFEAVAYSPLKDNPAVLAEVMQNWLPLLQSMQGIDSIKLQHYLVDMLGMPPDLKKQVPDAEATPTGMLPPPDQAGPPAGPPGGPGGPGGTVPPELMAQLQAVAPGPAPGPPPDGAPAPAPGPEMMPPEMPAEAPTEMPEL